MPFRNSCSASGALDVHARSSGWIDLLDQLDLTALQEAMQILDIAFLEAELGRCGRDLDVCEHADLLPPGDQTLDLFKLLKFHYRHLVARHRPRGLDRLTSLHGLGHQERTMMFVRAPLSELSSSSRLGVDPISKPAGRTSAEGEPDLTSRGPLAPITPRVEAPMTRGTRGRVSKMAAAALSPVREARELDSVVVAEFALH
jgi:hypothetical protein